MFVLRLFVATSYCALLKMDLCTLFIILFKVLVVNSHFHKNYDFIVVGAGVGGSTVANRLSENGRHTVLLLEAGGMPDPDFEIPVMSSILLAAPHPNVRVYSPVPQQNVGLDSNGVIVHPAGRVLGGGSTVNGMVFNRGSPHDFNSWSTYVKDDSWNYTNLLPYFKKSENYQGDFPSDQHGYDGPLTVTRPTWAPGLAPFLAAGQELGYQIRDQNGPQTVSFSRTEFSRRNGRRVSSFDGYIRPIMGSRKNLDVVINAPVSRVIFEGTRAIGVVYSTNSNGREHVARATKEVILSAGAFESPAVLMRSGIGPRTLLEQVKIPIIKELPVGQNLQDHLSCQMDFIINDTSQVFVRERDLTLENLQIWRETGYGPYNSWHGSSGQAFLQTSFTPKDKDWADIHLLALNSPGIPALYTPRDDISIRPGEVVTTQAFSLARPKSRGFVTLNTTNLNGPPVINFRYLSHPQDLEIMLEGLKMTLQLFENTTTYQKLGGRVPTESLRSCRQFRFRSDDYWRCYIRARTGTMVHDSGTCKMGRGAEDSTAVVDNTLAVIGIEGLRVVDASIMPTVTNANLQAAIYGIAEKAADMILETWERSPTPNRFLNRN